MVGLILLLAAPLATALPPSADDGLVVAIPGSWLLGYANPQAAVATGGTLTLLNVDIRQHDVVAYQVFGSNDQAWCGDFFPGFCPIFWSPLADGVGGGGSNAVEVLGLEALAPGQSYPYYCSIHENMHGTLTVLPET